MKPEIESFLKLVNEMKIYVKDTLTYFFQKNILIEGAQGTFIRY